MDPEDAVLLDPQNLLGEIHPEAQRAVRKLARVSRAALRIRSGRRTCEEQRGLYRIGRSSGGTPVTNADGCLSWHVLGRAVDFDILDPTGQVVSSCEPYAELGALWEQMGGVWGGRFSGFGSCGDAGHFEWHPGQKIADFCPDPSACEEVEAAIDQEISRAYTRGMITTAAVTFSVLAIGIGGAWYILRADS
jgi:hypothetical protein